MILLITNIISKFLAITMLLLIPISVVGMFFNFWLFADILSIDVLIIMSLGIYSGQLKYNTLQKIGPAIMTMFIFFDVSLDVIMADCIFREMLQALCLFPSMVGLALVIAGKEVKEDDKD